VLLLSGGRKGKERKGERKEKRVSENKKKTEKGQKGEERKGEGMQGPPIYISGYATNCGLPSLC